MKNLQSKISEGLIIEAAAKNVHSPRKGSTIYVLKKGESKAVPLKVQDVRKINNGWYSKSSGGYDIVIELEDKAFDLFEINGWTEPHFGKNWDYSDEKYQVAEIGDLYVGVSKDAIQSYINSKGSNKLEGILKQIERVQKELDELMQKKQKAEAEANLEVNESLK